MQPEGSGTADDPYKIANLNNLYWLSQQSTGDAWSKHYIQTAENIDATAVASLDGGKGFTPIGNLATKFTGTYNGQGHTISNLFINRPETDYVGLFGYVHGENAKIENFGLIGVNITGKNYVGGLVGRNNGEITNSYLQGSVNGNNEIGGLVGHNYGTGTISNSYSTGSVTGQNSVGGLVGINIMSGTITNSYSQGSVTGNASVGGLVGYNEFGIITNSYSQGSVTGTNNNVGGLVGTNVVGGIITNSFWDTEIYPTNNYVGTGKTTEQMQDVSTFTTGGASWDFTDTWKISQDNYPVLIWQNTEEIPEPPVAEEPTNGDGTAENPYKIANLNNLYWLSQNQEHWNKHYIQTAEINATAVASLDGGKGFTPIGNNTTKFTGTYDGQGHTISNLFIDRPSTNSVGLFGYVNTEYAKIENIGVINANITGKNSVGGLVGYIAGYPGITAVNISYITGGDVKGTKNFVGGLIGSISEGSVKNSYSNNVNVEGIDYVGGLIGNNTSSAGSIINTYSNSNVTGNFAGGILGKNFSSLVNSFWNTNTETIGIGYGMATGITGKTTAEMKQQSTFTDWDFVTIWTIEEDVSYPTFKLIEEIIPTAEKPIGFGTQDLPFEIETLENLVWLSEHPEVWYNKYFIQTANIDASASAEWYGGKGFNPIGNKPPLDQISEQFPNDNFAQAFRGYYDGQDYEISNLTINRYTEDYVGLFGMAGNSFNQNSQWGQYVNNIILTNANIIGKDNVGAIAGWTELFSINNVEVSGSVIGNNYVGGISGCSNEFSAYAVYSHVNVEGNDYIGGFAGGVSYRSISARQCYSDGTVKGNNYVGGLIGSTVGDNSSYLNHNYLYSTSDVTATGNYVGGLIGYMNNEQLNQGYSKGQVNATGDNVGGLIGSQKNQGDTLQACFWDKETSTKENSDGGQGETTENMTSKEFFETANWNFNYLYGL